LGKSALRASAGWGLFTGTGTLKNAWGQTIKSLQEQYMEGLDKELGEMEKSKADVDTFFLNRKNIQN
jgi:hypothetical protein